MIQDEIQTFQNKTIDVTALMLKTIGQFTFKVQDRIFQLEAENARLKAELAKLQSKEEAQ